MSTTNDTTERGPMKMCAITQPELRAIGMFNLFATVCFAISSAGFSGWWAIKTNAIFSGTPTPESKVLLEMSPVILVVAFIFLAGGIGGWLWNQWEWLILWRSAKPVNITVPVEDKRH